ncbi:MAG: hypothetical protein AABY04_02875 [Candidatus Micrarchaeota archaeon]
MDRSRSVLKIGNSSLSISLPRDWVVRNGIIPGQQLTIRDSADSVIEIHAKPKPSKLIAKVNANLETDMALRKVIGAYVSGASQIEVHGGNAGYVCELSRSMLSGVELADEREGSLVLEVFDNQYGKNSGEVFKRFYSLTSGMIDLAQNSCQTGKDNCDEISKRELEIDRLYILFLRNMSSKDGGNKILDILAAKLFERLADNAEILGRDPSHLHGNKKLAELVESAKYIFKIAYEAILKSSAKSADFEFIKEFLKKVNSEDSSPKNQKAEIFAIYHALEKIGEYSMDLLEIAIDNYRIEQIAESSFPLRGKPI